jgi:hypothetical protein
LRFYSLADDDWTQVLLTHLANGGCIVIERTGDLLIMPEVGVDSGRRLDT